MRECGADFLAQKLGGGGTCLHGLMAVYQSCRPTRQVSTNPLLLGYIQHACGDVSVLLGVVVRTRRSLGSTQ